jgi:hypothetical protein
MVLIILNGSAMVNAPETSILNVSSSLTEIMKMVAQLRNAKSIKISAFLKCFLFISTFSFSYYS